jgi:hypothetical protein
MQGAGTDPETLPLFALASPRRPQIERPCGKPWPKFLADPPRTCAGLLIVSRIAYERLFPDFARFLTSSMHWWWSLPSSLQQGSFVAWV